MASTTPRPRFATDWRTIEIATGEITYHKNWRAMETFLADKGRDNYYIEKSQVHRGIWKRHNPDLPQTVALKQQRAAKRHARCDAIRTVLEMHWGTDATIDELVRTIDAAIKKAAEQ